MANIKSQIKRNRQNERRHERNKSVRSALKTASKTVRQKVAELYADITRDGGMDEEEMEAVGWFFQAVQDFVMAQRQQAAQQPQPERPGIPQSNEEDYGTGRGTPVENYV